MLVEEAQHFGLVRREGRRQLLLGGVLSLLPSETGNGTAVDVRELGRQR